jgi:MFS family permease
MSALTSNNIDNRISADPNDGLVDLFIGLGILIAGLFLLTEMVWLVAIFIPTFLPSFQAARKRFLEPRIARSGVKAQQHIHDQKIFLYTVLLVGMLFLGGIGLFFISDLLSSPFSNWLRQYILLVIGLIFGSVWGFAGIMFKINRFYLYAVLTFSTLAAVQFLNVPFWLSLLFLGGMVTFVGLTILIRFVQHNPIVN